MNSNSFNIVYKNSTSKNKGYSLEILGSSLVGVNKIIKEFVDIANFNNELDIKVNNVKNGSIIIELLFYIDFHLLFTNIQDLYNFLLVADPKQYKEVAEFFSNIDGAHKSINNYYSQFPLTGEISMMLIGIYIGRMMHMSGKQKEQLTLKDENGNKFPIKYAQRLQNFVKRGGFKKALSPIVEGDAEEIIMEQAEVRFKISEENIENFLPEDDQILPEYEDGMNITFTGKIVALQSTKGESVKFKANEINSELSLLTAYPEEGKGSEEYVNFYKKDIVLRSQIYRKSMYVRPAILIKSVELMQEQLI